MKLTIVGSGDAFGTTGKLNTCFHLSNGETNVLVDCGATSLPAIKRLGIDPNAISTIFITHFHGDHFGGVPFFLLDALLVQKRTAPLTLVGPVGLQERIRTLQEALFQGSSTLSYGFDIHFIEIPSHNSQSIPPFEAAYFPVVHSADSNPHGVRLSWDDKIFSYSGDTEWTDNLIPLATGSDLFIVECYNYSGDVKLHMNYEQLVANRTLLNTHRIALTHLGNDMMVNRDKVELEICEDGQVMEI